MKGLEKVLGVPVRLAKKMNAQQFHTMRIGVARGWIRYPAAELTPHEIEREEARILHQRFRAHHKHNHSPCVGHPKN